MSAIIISWSQTDERIPLFVEVVQAIVRPQPAFLADMEAAGAYTALAEGLDRALSTLEAWGLLKGKAS
jgi:hypothetical protein